MLLNSLNSDITHLASDARSCKPVISRFLRCCSCAKMAFGSFEVSHDKIVGDTGVITDESNTNRCHQHVCHLGGNLKVYALRLQCGHPVKFTHCDYRVVFGA